MPDSLSNKRIVKNTFYLYIRMGVTMIVQFYTSRVTLNVLGVNDYGLWSVIASLIVAFSFVSGPLASATQRFLSFEIGKSGENLRNIFSTSLVLFIIMGGILCLILETLGVWFLNTHMNIPSDKIVAANWVYQFSIFAFLATFIRMPYESAIIAHEKMSFYAIVCIIEAFLLLGIIYFLLIPTSIDKLVLYGALTFLSKSAIAYCYKLYCNKKISCTIFKFKKDNALIKEILSFSGWNLFGALSSVTATQGVNVVLNMFFGVVVNAAYGIASQVGAGVTTFVGGFQRAANPQIVKSYALKDYGYMQQLVCAVSKYSFFLLFALVCPIMYNIHFLLGLWLGKTIPMYTAIFCNLFLLQIFLVSLAGPLETAVFAKGNIRNYQVTLSVLILMNIVVSYTLFKVGDTIPYHAIIIKCVVEIFIFVARLYFVTKAHVSITYYVRTAVLPISLVIIATTFVMYLISEELALRDGWTKLIVTCAIYYPLYAGVLWFLGINKKEKVIAKQWIFSKFSK